jgi:hypothetical protein
LTNGNLLDVFNTDYIEDESADAYVAFEYVPRFFRNERFQDIVKTQIMIWILGISVLSASYIAHVILMKFHVMNDDQMSDRFRKTVLDIYVGQDISYRVDSMSIVQRIGELFVISQRINMNSIGFNPEIASKWYEWPIMRMSGLLFRSDGRGTVFLHPNPIIWSFALIGVAGVIILILFVLIWGKDRRFWFC